MRHRVGRFALLGAAASLGGSVVGVAASSPASAAPAAHVAAPSSVAVPTDFAGCTVTAVEGEVGTQFGNPPVYVWLTGAEVNPLWASWTVYWAAYFAFVCV